MAMNTSSKNMPPIFIHSLFRSGSTYLFQVFRRSVAEYWCYQEPLHEKAFFCRENPSDLLDVVSEKFQLLRHPAMEWSYFKELVEVWPAWKDDINERMIYDGYFDAQGEDTGIAYWGALARAAKGRAVFQECRTSGRIEVIKNIIDSKHIYLWRNPWDQWWSYKILPYFDVANQLIVNARQAPLSLRYMIEELKLSGYQGCDLVGAFEFYYLQPLTSEQSYLIFYHLWCLALREGSVHADLMLNVDRLSDSTDYQFESIAQLKAAGIDGIDFSDCQVPQGRYLERDRDFFKPLEDRVHQWLKAGGWTREEIEKIQVLRTSYQPASWTALTANLASEDLIEQACRARLLAMRFETTVAQNAQTYTGLVSQLESRVHVAEEDARAQLRLAQDVSREAQHMVQQADVRAEAHQQHANALQIQFQQSQSRIDELRVSNDQLLQQICVLETERNALQQSQSRIDELRVSNDQLLQQICVLETERNALRQSASWRITAPLRCIGGGLSLFRKPKSIQQWTVSSVPNVIHRLTILMLNMGVGYAQSSPHFRRFVLWGLERMPGLGVKLRQMHLASQLRPVTAASGWGEQANSRSPVSIDLQINKKMISQGIPPVLHGVNLSQRTPLEANFSAYREIE